MKRSTTILIFIMNAALAAGAFAVDEFKITADDAAELDYFGRSVSISGDCAVIGAYQDDDDEENSGSAYIFIRDGEECIQQAKLTADDAAESDQFGYSVSISGDYVVIGAPYDDDDGDRSGSAYIFIREGADWAQQVKLTAADAEGGDNFGWSVSISGDYAVVGAYRDDDAGSVYIFVRDGADWTQQAKLTANDADREDQFGCSVSISGDYAVIGAQGDDDYGSWSGSAYIFVREGADWAQQAKLTADDSRAEDYFGISVSISDDYAVIGAYFDDDDGSWSGSAYIFVREGADWAQQAKLTADDADREDQFGCSVSISGDYAVIGAQGDDDYGGWSGSAYIFVREGADWAQQAKLTADDAAGGDYFGNSVSISGDYATVGAPGNDNDGECSGSAYIYSNLDFDIVESHETELPTQFSLSQPYPNPFNAVTQLSFDLPTTSNVSLQVFDLKGQLVTTLTDQTHAAGRYTVLWNGQDAPAGIYLARMEADAFSAVRKMILIR